MQVSVSQVEKYLECPRKWAFDRLFRLREPGMRYGFVFGNVLHAVLERWLKADDSGRDPLTGKAVDLYPPGWQWDLQAGKRIEPAHEELIKRLVQQSIDKGILVREPGRRVEDEFWGIVNHDPLILINGRVDLKVKGKIVDHKSTKDTRYTKSETELFTNLQGGVYAYRMFQKYPDLDRIEFQHHCYDWTNEKVFVRRAKAPATDKGEGYGITRKQAEAIWKKFQRAAMEMHTLKENVKDPFQVPAAMHGAGAGPDACAAFGGCGFVGICRKGTAEEFLKVKQRLQVLTLPREVQDELEADMAKKSDLKNKLNKKAKVQIEDDEDEQETPSPAPSKKGKKAATSPWGDEEDEDEEGEVTPPTKKKSKAKIQEEPEEEEEEEDEAPPPKSKGKKKVVVEEEEEDEDEDEEGEEEDEDEGDEKDSVAQAILATNEATLMKLPQKELVRRLLAVFAALKGL